MTSQDIVTTLRDDDFLFALPTSILVESYHYKKAIDLFYSDNFKLIMSVIEYEISPFLALTKVDVGYASLFPDKYSYPTKELPKKVVDCGCFYIANRNDAANVSKLIDLKPIYPYLLRNEIGIDLDDDRDWNKLIYTFKKLRKDNREE